MRSAAVSRKTKETDIALSLTLDGAGRFSGSSGIGFLDHMLDALCVHSRMDLTLAMTGDLEVDCHHSAEDLGIVLGQAMKEALGDRAGIRRYGTAFVPMDESLAFCSLDISGRAYLVYDAKYEWQTVGELDTAMVGEFFRALANAAGLTLHLAVVYGSNDHHKIEALFKAFAHALADAKEVVGGGVLSSKQMLD
ncbi:MAG: imidazoleglycerol-phosphate dehydratase HisB [Lachnospiraceae bacterium]|nr:imidazoleglycerol-phosphate dehydratase HisB [Lachnospiraceae bacterium]